MHETGIMGINTFWSHAPKGLDKEWYLIAEILFSAIASMLATQRRYVSGIDATQTC